ncbi:hypothetical protein BD626DRAFT_567668 [Schizophyllum amplum]|uniref:DUF6534 domain-containing protein n=1 Tax=Schizophyllum amplum TaxID=97359 RepID=A0A550CJ68_9AGAR|nr:hypothetical protein BD626DRAFT_567668 [Auriculariopsis ampla]
MDSPTTPDNPIETPLGMLLIGLIISCALYGLNFLQIYLYFRTFPKDSWWLRYMVALLLALDTAGTALSGHGVYTYLVKEFGNVAAIAGIDTSLEVESQITNVITFIVQVFYGYSLIQLAAGRNLKWIAYTIFFLAFLSFAFGTAAVVNNFLTFQFEGLTMKNARIISGFALGGAALCDIVITAALSSFFYNSKTGFKPTDNILDKLLIFTINRGAVAFVVQVLNCILYFTHTAQLIWTPFHFALSKVYAISLVATLNQRDSYRNDHVYSEDPVSFARPSSITASGVGNQIPLQFRSGSGSEGETTGMNTSFSKNSEERYRSWG